MLPTPDMSHMTDGDKDRVYEPAEDSFLFLDALEKEQPLISKITPTICVEIGSGSGIVTTFLAKMLDKNAVYITTDINKDAADLTKRTAEQNHIAKLVNPIVMNLADGLLSQLHQKVDILLFNPPYVVTPSEEVGSQNITASWAGGVRGREVIDRFLPCVPSLLSKKGLFYLVTIQENDRVELEKIMSQYGLKMNVVLERRSGPERLAILRFSF